MTRRVTLEYTTVRGKHVIVVLESKTKAMETLKRLKEMKIVQTYAKGRKTRSLILTAYYCPICNKIMPVNGKNVVTLLNPIGREFSAHRSCCEKAKVPYRMYDPKKGANANWVVYPK